MATGSSTPVGQISRRWSFILLAVLMATGTVTQLVFKEMGQCEINGQEFNHPFMQSVLMFIGEALCYPIFMYYKKRWAERYRLEIEEAEKQGKITQVPYGKIAIPTTIDEIASTLSFFALALMPVSIYSMLRGGGLIFVALFSKIFLKAKFNNQKLLGLAIVTIGVTIVGVGAFINSPSNPPPNQNIPLGMFLIVLSMISQSSQVVLEQKYFSDYELNPFEMVGVEGMWGILISTYVALIGNAIPCPGKMNCGGPHLENVGLFFTQMFTFSDPDGPTNQPMLILMVIASIFCILILNAVGMAVTKFDSALTRQVAGVTYPFFLWIICLLIGWEDFIWEQLLGYLVLAAGSVLYNHMIQIQRLQDIPPTTAMEADDDQDDTENKNASEAGQSLIGYDEVKQ